jgi:hypothetical protein
MFVEDILKQKEFLLKPKRSDKFVVPLYKDGWRYCHISLGNKHAFVRPLTGDKRSKISRKKLQEELCDTYWWAARCHSSRGLKKKPRNWHREYA